MLDSDRLDFGSDLVDRQDVRSRIEALLPAGRVDERTRDAIRILVPLVKELAAVKP